MEAVDASIATTEGKLAVTLPDTPPRRASTANGPPALQSRGRAGALGYGTIRDALEPEVISPAAAADGLSAVVTELNEASRAGTMDLYARLGRIVIARLYRGDLAIWRAQGIRDVSFRRLASRSGKDLAVSETTLYRAVALCELTDRLGLSTWKHLGVSHVRVVLGLPERDQRRLLLSAEKERWTVQQMEGEAAKLRRKDERRGRPALPAFVKTVRRLTRVLADPQQSLGGLDRVADLEDEEVHRLRTLVTEAQRQLGTLLNHLTPRNGAKARPT